MIGIESAVICKLERIFSAPRRNAGIFAVGAEVLRGVVDRRGDLGCGTAGRVYRNTLDLRAGPIHMGVIRPDVPGVSFGPARIGRRPAIGRRSGVALDANVSLMQEGEEVSGRGNARCAGRQRQIIGSDSEIWCLRAGTVDVRRLIPVKPEILLADL